MTPWLDDGDVRLYHGDALDVLRELPDGSVDCCVTSPPYWGLRDYGIDGQLGLEATPDEYVAGMVGVFREVRRVLADHGTCWVNLGDSYTSGNRDGHGTRVGYKQQTNRGMNGDNDPVRAPQPDDLKPKDLVGIPWRVAFALQADGWYLRSDIVWAKPNPMPESVTDRPTKAHEYVFLLTKRPRYFFDQEAVREKADWERWGDQTTPKYNGTDTAAGWIKPKSKQELTGEPPGRGDTYSGFNERYAASAPGERRTRNVRSVWTIATQPYPEAHFATFPEELARRCILAGCPERVCRECGKASERMLARKPTGFDGSKYGERAVAATGGAKSGGTAASTLGSGGGTLTADYETVGWSDCGHNTYRPGLVLDPFIGSGTVAKIARDHKRHTIGIDLNEQYLELAARRLQQLSLLTGGTA